MKMPEWLTGTPGDLADAYKGDFIDFLERQNTDGKATMKYLQSRYCLKVPCNGK